MRCRSSGPICSSLGSPPTPPALKQRREQGRALRLQSSRIYPIFPDLIADDPLSRTQEPRGPGAVASSRLERILNQAALESFNGTIERSTHDRAGRVGGL